LPEGGITFTYTFIIEQVSNNVDDGEFTSLVKFRNKLNTPVKLGDRVNIICDVDEGDSQ